MTSSLIKLINHINYQIKLIQNSKVDLIDKITLARSLLENYAVLNFLKTKDTRRRIELFQCFGDFEWYSHQIYYSHSSNKRLHYFYQFLIKIKENYSYGYYKYGRLIKRRACKQLRKLINVDKNHAKQWQKQLDLLNSDKPQLKNQQRMVLAKYLSHHLITKLPFPYRIAFGKSITHFVLKYSPINKTRYWLLADLSHGTLTENHINSRYLNQIIKEILRIINSRINQK